MVDDDPPGAELDNERIRIRDFEETFPLSLFYKFKLNIPNYFVYGNAICLFEDARNLFAAPDSIMVIITNNLLANQFREGCADGGLRKPIYVYSIFGFKISADRRLPRFKS